MKSKVFPYFVPTIATLSRDSPLADLLIASVFLLRISNADNSS